MKSIDSWFSDYGESHQNASNKLIHWFCVPVIFFSILALLSAIPADFLQAPFPDVYHPYLHWGTLLVAVALLFYLRLSLTMALGVLAFSLLCLEGIVLLEQAPWPVWKVALLLFVVAWIGQFIGHNIEGKKPSFFKDLQFLLIGPAWLLGFIYRKLGIPY